MRKKFSTKLIASVLGLLLLLPVTAFAQTFPEISVDGKEMIPIRSAFADHGNFSSLDENGNIVPGDQIVWRVGHVNSTRVTVAVRVKLEEGVYDTLSFRININPDGSGGAIQAFESEYAVPGVLTAEKFNEIAAINPVPYKSWSINPPLPELKTLSRDNLGDRWFVSPEVVSQIDDVILNWKDYGIKASSDMRAYQPKGDE